MLKLFLYILPLLIALPSNAESVNQLSKQESSALSKAVDVANSAKQAARDAAKAAQEAIKASELAEQLAFKAEDAAYEAYLVHMASWRQARVNTLHEPQIPEANAVAITNPIDRFVMAIWKSDTEVPLCNDTTFIRRVFLDITGMIPAATEVQSFLDDGSENKRTELIDNLLARSEDYAAHWMQFWEDALCSNGKHQGGVGTRANFRDYIYESFKENKPYDVFTAQLIDPSSVRYRGGYVRADNHQDSLLTAGNIGQVFLGTRMKCATCHDDFLNYEWTQKRFYQFASFFAKEDLEIIRCEEPQGEYIHPAAIFENVELNEKQLNDLDGRLNEVTRFLIDPANPRFAAAFSNRLWKRYIGLGIVEPVDAFREDTDPSHPELLQWMAYEFAANGYDIKHMVRLILNSNTYQAEYNEKLADRFEEGANFPRLYRSPSLRKLTCEQYLDSVSLALGELKERISFDETTTALTLALGRPTTRNEVQTLRSDDVAVLQALEFINGPDLHKLVYESGFQDQLAHITDHEEAFTHLFLSMYSRQPTEDEMRFTLEFFGPEIEADEWADIMWSLTVSPEFQYIR